jgi:integron integrase
MGCPSERSSYAAFTPRPTLISVVRERLRLKHYSLRTEQSYVGWIRRFIRFHGRRHPREMGAAEVEAFLTSLAVDRKVSAATQNQALAALLFLYRDVLGINLPWLDGVTRAKGPAHVPVVLSRAEIERLFRHVDGTHGLMARLLYGTGMRLMECVRLRVKDVDFDRGEITVRGGKGAKDRVTVLPASLVVQLRDHLAKVRALWGDDRRDGRPAVEMPEALARKYPNAGQEWGWSGGFRPGVCRGIRAAERFDGTTPTSRRCSVPSSAPSSRPVSPSPLRATRCGTRSRPICSKRVTTSGRYRSCWVTAMSARR